MRLIMSLTLAACLLLPAAASAIERGEFVKLCNNDGESIVYCQCLHDRFAEDLTPHEVELFAQFVTTGNQSILTQPVLDAFFRHDQPCLDQQ